MPQALTGGLPRWSLRANAGTRHASLLGRYAGQKYDAAMRNGAKTMLTVNEAADLVGLSRIFVLQQIEAGNLSSIKVPADEPRVLRVDLLAWHARFREQQGAAITELGLELDHELNSSGEPADGRPIGHHMKG